MAPTTYTEVLARNIRAARSRHGLSQADVVGRMRALGFSAWHRPTLGNVERGDRGLRAEEVFGLAYALETSIGALLAPAAEDKMVEFPSGAAVAAALVAGSVRGVPDESVAWKNGRPVFAAASWPAGSDTSEIAELEKIAREFRAWKASQQGGGD